MARVPQVPQSRVLPQGGSVSVAMPEGAFGPLGDILAAGGKEAKAASDQFALQAEKMAAIDNKVAADGAVLSNAQRQQEFMLGWKQANQGMLAAQNLPAAMKELERIRDESGSGLVAPNARDLFNSQSRVGTLQATTHLSSFAASERLNYINKETEAQADLIANSMNPDNMEASIKGISDRAATLGAANGWGLAQASAFITAKVGAGAYSITAGLAPQDPVKAQAFYDANKEWMNPAQRTQAESLIRASTENRVVSSVADEAAAGAMVRGGTEEVWRNIIQRESGGRPGVLGPPTKYGRAEGLTQMLPATAKAMAAKLGIAWRPALMRGTSEEAAEYQEKLGRAYFAEGLERYGGDVVRAAMYYHGGPDEALWGPKTRAYAAAVAGGGNQWDNLETNAAAAYASIAQDPRLRGDVKLINQAQSQFMTNISQARTLHNVTVDAAQQRLIGAASANNVNDVARLTTLYPGALEDWNTLSPKAQQAFTNNLTAQANKWDPVKQDRYFALKGEAQSNPQAFLMRDITEEDIPFSAQKELFNLQQKIKKAGALDAFKNISINRALANPIIKMGVKDLNEDEKLVFTGAMMGELEQWAASNPGKKPTDADLQKMGNDLLTNRKAPYTTIFGTKSTFSRPNYEVPEYWAKEVVAGKTRLQHMTDALGHEPTPDEIARFYHGST